MKTAHWIVGALILAAAASATQPPDSPDSKSEKSTGVSPTLDGRVWVLEKLQKRPGKPPADKKPITIEFDPANKRASGYTGVNRFHAPYDLDGTHLKFGALVMTRRAGPPEAMKLEAEILAVLEKTDRVKIEADRLTLQRGDEHLASYIVQ